MAAIQTSNFPDTCDCHQWSEGWQGGGECRRQ